MSRSFSLMMSLASALVAGAFEPPCCRAQADVDPLDQVLVPIRRDAILTRVVAPGQPVLQPVEEEFADELPAEALKVMAGYEQEVDEIQRKAEQEKRDRREKAIVVLQELQDRYTREAKLDEALAIRSRIRQLKMASQKIYRDPGSLAPFHSEIGQSYYFEVVGSSNGFLWGTEVYTADSTLAKAAVHMGILRPGQRGVVKVTFLEGQDGYQGSEQHGVTSAGYGGFAFSYTVEPWRD